MNKVEARQRRKFRVRAALKRIPSDRARLTVNRTNRHIYAQIIDDSAGHTVAAASSLDAGLRETHTLGADIEAAKAVGKLIAERAVAAGITTVRFDRGGFIFHGRVRALAESAREAGLQF